MATTPTRGPRGLLWWLTAAVIMDVFLTTMMFIVLNNNTTQLHRTQVSLRLSQLNQQAAERRNCEKTNSQSIAIQAKDKSLLTQQQQALAALAVTLRSVPSLNTAEILSVSRANLQRTINIYEAEIKAFTVVDCKDDFPVPGDTPPTAVHK